jgi:peptidoglycan/xylan/chitin deacetylase (PgdA/CDA1 family)
MLSKADELGLAFVTFPELVPGPERAGVAIAFDDQAIEGWYGWRDIFNAHHAHVTFFVTRLYSRTPEEIALLAELAADGHAIEAHSVDHLDAQQYVCDHGADAYMTNEATPSIEGLRALGYPVTSYAYPFGNNNRETDDRLLHVVHRLRVSPGSCPY